MKHTSLPWSCAKSTVYWYPPGGTLEDDYIQIATCYSDSGFSPTYETQHENAKFIVRAVNNHYELIKTLRAITSADGGASGGVLTAIVSARALLAKMEDQS
jgi:hypothetical protein